MFLEWRGKEIAGTAVPSPVKSLSRLSRLSLSRFLSVGSLFALGLVACSGAANKDLFAGGGDGGIAANAADGGSCTLLCGDKEDGGDRVSVDNADGGKLEDGRVVGPTADANALLDAGCTAVSATKPPAYMLIVLDGSGSMGSDNKWSSVVPALDAVFDDLKLNADSSLGVGLLVFSDSLDPTAGVGPYPSIKDVSIGFVDQGQHDAMRARIDTAQSSSGTPTFAALSGAYKLLENFIPGPPLPSGGKKVMVLMTDGVPNGGAAEQDQCIAAATTELGKGITSFAVGIGPFPSPDLFTYDAAFMGKLAQAGGASPAGCNPLETQNVSNVCHFQITPNGKPVTQLKQEFIDALDRIRRDISSCEFGITGVADPSQFNVVFKNGNGQDTIIPENATDGFTFDDATNPTKVLLHGASCDATKLDSKGKVSFLTGCPTTH